MLTPKVFPLCTASDLILQIHGVQQYRLGGFSWTAKLGDTRILEPFDFAVTFLYFSHQLFLFSLSPSSSLCQIEILMYNIWKHCGAQVIYTLFVYFLMARQWSVLLIILLIVGFFMEDFKG